MPTALGEWAPVIPRGSQTGAIMPDPGALVADDRISSVGRLEQVGRRSASLDCSCDSMATRRPEHSATHGTDRGTNWSSERGAYGRSSYSSAGGAYPQS